MGKLGVPQLIVFQLIQAIYLLNKNKAQKNFVTKKSVYLAHFLFSYSYFYLFTVNWHPCLLQGKEPISHAKYRVSDDLHELDQNLQIEQG